MPTVVVAAPLGVAAGSSLWRAMADAVGLHPGRVIPQPLLLAGAAGLLVLSLLLAVGPGWRASRAVPARELRAV